MTQLRYRLSVAYDGTYFYGWAEQPGLRTVCGLLSRALRLILGESPNIVVAARTDAGVHAQEQVCHIDTHVPLDAAYLLRRLRSILKRERDLHIISAEKAPADFHARFSATGRRYVYRLADMCSAWYPQNRYYIHRVNVYLKDNLMRKAAEDLTGLRDFGTFCKPSPTGTTIRHLRQVEIIRLPDGRVNFYLESDAFCHSMIRNLVGALVEVGRGALTREQLALYISAAKRTPAIPTLPPAGLCLISIDYPSEYMFTQQNQKTRQKRTAKRTVKRTVD